MLEKENVSNIDNSKENIKFMHRCLQLAKLGRGTAQPNPMVGSVVVYNGEIIGEGYHHKCGQAHAEVNAINSVKDKTLLKNSTIYVNLEPCAHVGRTPACSTLIINSKIPRVVIGCVDSFDKVAGQGIQMLEKAGVDVEVGVLEQESWWLNRRFFTFHQKKRPYIILKWAETKDGFIDYDRSKEKPKAAWITNELSRAYVHKWRTEEPAFLVGTQTALKDNPQLNVRVWSGTVPLRVSVDREGVFPEDLHLLDDSQPTLIFTSELPTNKLNNTDFVLIDKSQSLEQQILDELYKREIQSLVVEGGQIVLDSFISANLWDEARVFTGDKIFKSGTNAPAFKYSISETYQLEDTELAFYYNVLG